MDDTTEPPTTLVTRLGKFRRKPTTKKTYTIANSNFVTKEEGGTTTQTSGWSIFFDDDASTVEDWPVPFFMEVTPDSCTLVKKSVRVACYEDPTFDVECECGSDGCGEFNINVSTVTEVSGDGCIDVCAQLK